MKIIQIPTDVTRIISTSSKGDQSKWCVGDQWVKKNSHGYESQEEFLASFVLPCTTLSPDTYVTYQSCLIELPDEELSMRSDYSDFGDKLQ